MLRLKRKLGVPCVVDRVIQQAILQVLTPLFDPEFSESSFGCRPRRSAHGAIGQVKAFVKSGYRIAVDLDLEKFFDCVNHDVLMSRIACKVGDKGILGLIGRYLRVGILVGSSVQATAWGTLQGSPLSPLSPLLSNILLETSTKSWKLEDTALSAMWMT